MKTPTLLRAIEKLAQAGERAGITVEDMIQILNAGVTVETLLNLLERRLTSQRDGGSSSAWLT